MASQDATSTEIEPSGTVQVKVAWLKQKKDEERKLPVLDFDEQQFYTFDRRRTTFRMVKHSCSYPAPPHKVRMWCSSLGASPDLPSTMDLNTFINTFELITEEKHTLEMAHLTGGETIAFEMVQGEQMSELSTFLLGSQLKQPPKVITMDKRSLKETLTQSVQKIADEFEGGRVDLSNLAGPHAGPILTLEEQARIASVLKEQAMVAELQRKKLADELIAEEEEEARRAAKKKAKKKGKKEKQKEKKKAQAAGDDDDDDDDDEAASPSAANGGGGAGGGAALCTACSDVAANGSAAGKANHRSGSGAKVQDDAEENENGAHLGVKKTSGRNGRLAATENGTPRSAPLEQLDGEGGPGNRASSSKKGAKATGKGRSSRASRTSEEEEEEEEEEDDEELGGLMRLIQLGVAAKGQEAVELEATWGALPDAAALHLQNLQRQVDESHRVISALCAVVNEERDAREAAERRCEELLSRAAADAAPTSRAKAKSGGGAR